VPDNARKTFFLNRRNWSRCLVAHVFAGLAFAVVAQADEEIDWAKEQQFWSFRAPIAAPQPAVKSRQWPTQPLDYLVLNRLEKSNLAPSQEADLRTLIRRVAFDLTGLPPRPEEMRSVLADTRPAAYERLVDRLLASPQFGERMASLWLPLVRYAEDQAHLVGTETQSFYPNAYKYRKWVINAFNGDLPYDRFITLQLAADKIVERDSRDLAAQIGRAHV